MQLRGRAKSLPLLSVTEVQNELLTCLLPAQADLSHLPCEGLKLRTGVDMASAVTTLRCVA